MDKKIFIFCLCALVAILNIPSVIFAASFDCSKASTKTEKTICANHALSQLDESLSKTYQEVLRSVRDPAGLKREQTKWLREVRNLCTDSVCLEKEYRSRLAVLEIVLSVTITGEKSAEPAETLVAPLRIIKRISDYRPVDYPILPYDGRLFFSQFDKSGNNFDILALDIANQSFEYILRGRPGAQFVAQDDKYLVVSEKGSFANPLVVIDRASGKRTSQIKLRQIISWARIKGNRLIVIQGTWMSGYATKAQALIFELPSLKVIKSLEITGGNDVQSWQGKILSLGYELAAYDDDFNELFKISLPTRKRGEGVSCAATGPLRIYGDKAVIVANCGEILIYDLSTRQLERTIPSYSHFYAVAIIDGLIFTTPTSGSKQKDNAHVYDLYTGKEVAVMPINATHLFAKGNRLLAVEREFAKPSPMTFYSVDVSVLRSGQWRVEQVLKECQKAEALWVDSSDLYGAIGLCQSAGIEGLTEEANNSKSILSVIKRYAFWLSKTLDRTRDATRIFEALQKTAPDEEINRALAEVRLKTRVLEGNEVDSLTAEEQQTDFARALDIGNRLRRAETKNIEFGAFSNLFHFSGNRIYIGRYGCWRSSSDGGASIGVLDRNTFEEIASIPIAPDDQEYQDYITSITSDENRIYASVEYRYEQTGRPNFFMIDKASLKILKEAQVEALSTLIVESGQLLVCKKHEQGYKILDPVTTKMIDAPDKVCVIAGERGDNTVVRLPSDQAESSLFVALTKDYLVGHASWPKGAHYIFYPRVPASKPISVQLSPHDLLDRPISISGNEILVSEGTRKGQLIKLVSVPTGVTKTLFGLPTSRSRMPVPLLYDQTLFVALGRDLLIFNIKNNLLQRYIKNFIPAPFKDNGSGLDMNRIGRLMIDRGRLIALTSYGENCQIVPLSSLVVADR